MMWWWIRLVAMYALLGFMVYVYLYTQVSTENQLIILTAYGMMMFLCVRNMLDIIEDRRGGR